MQCNKYILCLLDGFWKYLRFLFLVYWKTCANLKGSFLVAMRHLLDILDKVAIDDIPVIQSVANLCSSAYERLRIKCVEIVAKSDMDIVTLEKALPPDIVKQVMEARSNLDLQGVESPGLPDKHVRRIYRALDSDDIELVIMLLKEGHTSLDDAYALHYAVAQCDMKITKELLDLDLADVNHMNPRGYSVLHVAAMKITMELLDLDL